MLKLPQSYMAKIPNEYKREFIDNVCRENFLRMLVIAVLLVVFEPPIAFFTERPDTVSFYLALGLALFNLIFIPILYYLQKNVKKVSKFWLMLIQTIFLAGILTGGISLSLSEQPSPAAISTYFLAVFTISAFIIMPPRISAVLLLTSNLVFMLLLPQVQVSPAMITTLNINTLSMTAVAWILNQMVSQTKVNSYINEKIIIEKNIELEKKNTELNELTMRDSMTNLLNHKNSLRRLKEEVDRAKRIDYPLSVAMIDLDNFKLVNDTYGHQTGDEVLIRVSQILSESCRTTDVVGRYGGEEFIIIMPDTNDQDAALLLERIKTCIEGTSFKDGIRITLSCGISELNGESVHGILKSSDMMLYEAKKKGKNRVEVQMNKAKKSAAIN
ncbi:MAG TPA: diguanylate cyclase [Anaerovoracaceae bacterium]|nr:diguanylate cyclase [Anaerovoracaceae bacterium]